MIRVENMAANRSQVLGLFLSFLLAKFEELGFAYLIPTGPISWGLDPVKMNSPHYVHVWRKPSIFQRKEVVLS